ncbi:MAG: SDR family oxidoreductase [Sphingomonadaceae bacterium]|nr:SDR family oxidoreductase [Sphingomonadaceae bacterium]
MIEFTGKHVLVTGGSQGIGYETAKAFADAGAEVKITGTRAAVSDYDDDLSGFAYISCDVSDAEQRAALCDGIEKLDVLVNNAGLGGGEKEFEMETFRHVLEVNLMAIHDITNRLFPLLDQSGGNIVNIGSCASFLSIPNAPAYTTSKAAVLGITRAQADQGAKAGVRANMVAPGFIETRMTSGLDENEAFKAKLLRTIPMRRMGTPDEIAPVILFLASGGASYITGQSLIVDGGLVLH